MQSQTSKVVLAELGGPDYKIASGDTFESVVSHEIKELGQHVLACSVTYQLPSKARLSSGVENTADTGLQAFRKFYKFIVSIESLQLTALTIATRSPIHSPSEPKYIHLGHLPP
jgi:trafficking protein particle complex subunit 13